MSSSLSNIKYLELLQEIKSSIHSAQIKASLSVNSILINFYWNLGKKITEEHTNYGTNFIENLSKDLRLEFPNIKGLSYRNLALCRQFYCFYGSNEILQQAVAELPWGHNILIISKTKDVAEAEFYIQQTICNGWSREVLALQIKSNLYSRQGKAITNFTNTLVSPLSELAQQALKDPYIFDFIELAEPYKEKDIENQLILHVTKFLLELGKGFAFLGKQYHLEIADNDYYIDLLFYHVHLKCYIVIELKNTRFIPEYAGKLNFYLSAVDSLIKKKDDNPTIGILLCRDKNNIEAEFSLRGINKPIGVSEFQITEILPENLKSSLPTIEELEQELSKLGNYDNH
jgi:predicted nuclease of restriction endonuclease-like (RecB) superfamily